MNYIRTVLNILMVVSILGVMMGSCSKTGAGQAGKLSNLAANREGWVNDDTYQMTVIGQWNREIYYLEGEPSPKDTFGKTVRVGAELQEEAKIAAKIKARRTFKEKMTDYVAGVTQVKEISLVANIVEDALREVTLELQAKSEKYSKEYDTSIVFHIQARDLKMIINDAAEVAFILVIPEEEKAETSATDKDLNVPGSEELETGEVPK